MMPVPVIHFTKQMTPDERLKSLNKMKDWCQSSEGELAQAKTIILKSIIAYATANLVATSRFSFKHSDYADELDCQLCDKIFFHADLPEILFLQYVINQINLTTASSHPIRNDILAMGALALVTRFNMGIIVAGIAIICSEKLVNWRIEKSLENMLALKELHGIMPRVEDGYDNVINMTSRFASQGALNAMSFFNKVILPAVMAEKKNTQDQPALRK
jgi:hypothetical protein